MSVFLIPFFSLVIKIIDFYSMVVIFAVIMNLLFYANIINTYNRFVLSVSDFLYRLTEPVFYRVRALMPRFGNIDLSPLIVILGLSFLREMIVAVMHAVV